MDVVDKIKKGEPVQNPGQDGEGAGRGRREVMRRAAAFLIAALLLASGADVAFAQYTVLTIIITRSNPAAGAADRSNQYVAAISRLPLPAAGARRRSIPTAPRLT